MSPYYGNNPPPQADVIPDWLLGGNRKRRLIHALAHPREPGGWTAAELVTELSCGRTTVFETLRALRPLRVLEQDADGRVRLDVGSALGRAIVALLDAVEPYGDTLVDRPPRSRTRGR